MTTGSPSPTVRRAATALAAFLLAVPLFPVHAASKSLFPAPLHITREIVSPVSKTKSVVEEYCNGNRIVSVSGSRTAIVDYDKGEVTEIDFAAGTYSVTKFEAIAKAHEGMPQVAALAANQAREWKVEARGGNVVASRPGETIEAERTSNRIKQNIRITADTQLRLSRGAVEALMGLSYPNTPDASASIVLDALRPERPKLVANSTSASSDDEYRLPLEHIVRFDIDGETVESRSVIMRLGAELAPPDVLAIPPGAKLVESRAVAVRKQLDELEHPASQR